MTDIIDVLDHGWVKLRLFWGSDKFIAETAHISRDKYLELSDVHAKKLIGKLLKRGHVSPFEFSGMSFQLYLPLFVAAQLKRHRSFDVNEQSSRYRPIEQVYYVPELWRSQNAENALIDNEKQHIASGIYKNAINAVKNAETELINLGVAFEISRLVVPSCKYTSIAFQGNIRDTMFMLKSRLANDAQYETRLYADAMRKIFAEQFPETHAIFQTHILNK